MLERRIQLDPAEQTALSEALDRMWVKFLPQIEERVVFLESAAAAFSANQLSIEQQEAAKAAAHKLAGVLGTFSLAEGTVLARELEVMYSREGGPDPALNGRSTEITAELRTIVAGRK
jgi:HPt (histidine-containing phosphotransfer) domain-containing protein